MKQIVFVVCVLLVAVLRSGEAAAQGQPNMYGPTITADQAKSVAAAAVAEARRAYKWRPRRKDDGWWVRAPETAVMKPTRRDRQHDRWS